MKDINRLILMGSFSSNPEVMMSKGGRPYAKFKFKTSTVVGRDKSGKLKFEAVWFNCICFGKTAEYLQKMEVQEKDRAYIEGRWSVSKYTKSDGANAYWQQVVCDEVVPIKASHRPVDEEELDSPEGFTDDFGGEAEEDAPF